MALSTGCWFQTHINYVTDCLSNRGGVPPGGPPGGGWGPPPLPMPQAHQGKLVGEPPTIYDGDRKKTTLFINEWELYWAVNNDNTLMINPY